MATDFQIATEDRPGELAKIGEAMGKAGVNIEGLCGFGTGSEGIVHICVLDATSARIALEDAGLSIAEVSDAILTDPFSGSQEPGTLGKMARAIADAGVNVRVLYVATGDRGVLVTDNNAKAATVMGG